MSDPFSNLPEDLEMLPTIGERVRQCRIWKNLSQDDLGIECQSNQSCVQKIENNRSFTPRNIHKLAEALDVNPAWLQFGHEYAPMKTPKIPFGLLRKTS